MRRLRRLAMCSGCVIDGGIPSALPGFSLLVPVALRRGGGYFMRQPAGTGLLSVWPPFPRRAGGWGSVVLFRRAVLLPLGAPRFVWCPSGGGGSVRHGLDGALDAHCWRSCGGGFRFVRCRHGKRWKQTCTGLLPAFRAGGGRLALPTVFGQRDGDQSHVGRDVPSGLLEPLIGEVHFVSGVPGVVLTLFRYPCPQVAGVVGTDD